MAEKNSKSRLTELRGLDETDLQTAILNARKSIYQFRKDRLGKPQENVKIVKNSRKEIARALTIIRERELDEAAKG